MSTTHTPGRILFREGGEANQQAMLSEDGRWWLALLANGGMTTERQRANFRRLAACWNACEGISTWALETGPRMLQAYQREQDRADKAEREGDELRATLAALVRDADSEPDTEYLQGAGINRVAVHRNGIERARTALAVPTESAFSASTRCPDNGCSAEADPQPSAPYQTKCAKCGDTVPF